MSTFNHSRPLQDLEWIGDAALMTILRWQLVTMFPNTPFTVLQNVASYYCSNQSLTSWSQKFGLGKTLTNGNLVEVHIANLFLASKLEELRILVVQLLSINSEIMDKLKELNEYLSSVNGQNIYTKGAIQAFNLFMHNKVFYR